MIRGCHYIRGDVSMSGGICTRRAYERPSYHYELCNTVLLHLVHYGHQEFPGVVHMVGFPLSSRLSLCYIDIIW